MKAYYLPFPAYQRLAAILCSACLFGACSYKPMTNEPMASASQSVQLKPIVPVRREVALVDPYKEPGWYDVPFFHEKEITIEEAKSMYCAFSRDVPCKEKWAAFAVMIMKGDTIVERSEGMRRQYGISACNTIVLERESQDVAVLGLGCIK